MLEKLNTVLLSENCPRMVLLSITGQVIGLIILRWLLGKGRKVWRYIVFMGRSIFTIYFGTGESYAPNAPCNCHTDAANCSGLQWLVY